MTANKLEAGSAARLSHQSQEGGVSEQLVRILLASHSHPKISKGGAEIAAFQLFSSLRDKGYCHTWFLGCERHHGDGHLGAVFTQPFSDHEYIYAAGEFEWFNFANRDPNFPDAFVDILTELTPNIVHFHHYIVFGVEAFLLVRRALPDAKIILTLHEYLAICNHHGQMITSPNRYLCYESSLISCNRCFPQFGRSDFFLRRMYISRFFDLVDHFISPSHFLAERYVTWGIPETKISVIENVIPAPTRTGEVPPVFPSLPLRVGFFGQISALKGINVLFDAARILEAEKRTDICFDVFGDYRMQPADLQKEFLEQLEKLGSNVRFHGPYEPSRVDRLMGSVDVVVMPSIWWENSPVVIQEAFRNRRPMVCSDIGGMAEKVRDGIDGFHFPVGSAAGLVALLTRLAADPEGLRRVSSTMRTPPAADAIVDAHRDLYTKLLTG